VLASLPGSVPPEQATKVHMNVDANNKPKPIRRIIQVVLVFYIRNIRSFPETLSSSVTFPEAGEQAEWWDLSGVGQGFA
jgi:hypothetical protein